MAASVQIPVTQTGLEASIQAALRNAGKGAQINLGTNSRQINALAQPLGRITGQADEFTKSMEAANARVFAFGASVGIINGVTSAFSSLVKSTIAVEKSLTEINSVFQKSSSELEKFGNSLFDVAKNTGQSFDAVAKGALELARQGLSTEESLRRINDALILTRLSGLDAERSVSGLTAAVNAFKSTGITTSEVLNKLVVVSQKYSVSEKDLIEGLKRSSSVAKQAGVSFDELVGIITAVQEKTSVGGAVIGNSFKTIFTRLQRTDTLDALQQLGVSVTDVQGRILPATKLLENLAGTIKSLNQVQLAEITEKVGGGFQIDKLLATLEDLSSQSSVAFKATEISLKSTNQAYEKNAALNVTLAALINKTSLSAEQLGATLGKIGITDSAKSLLGFFNGLLEGIQKILGEESALGDVFRGLAKGIGNLVTGPGLALFAAIILKLSKDLAQFGFASLKGFFGIGKAAKEIQNVEQSIASALSRNVGLQRQLFALEGNRAAQIKLMSDAIVLQEAAMRRMASTANTLAAPLYGAGVRSTGEGLRVPKAAGGYMPAVSQESSDIKKGVGGARSGDRPVVIPNFNFGQGKKGSIVAHTGEYAVPNFAGSGGTAIFNRDMVRSMGLPSGAKKIGASGGLIPNFANVTQANNIVKFNNYPVQEVISKKGSLQQINKVDTIDQFSGKVEIIEQKRNNNEYNKATNKLIDQFWGKENKDGNNEKLNRILSSMGGKGIDQQYLARIRTSYGKRDHSSLRKQFKGALGELDAKKLSGQQLASGNAYMDLVGGGEIKTTIATPFSGIASKIMNDYLSSGPNLRNFTKDGKPKLDKVNAQKLPLYMPVGGKVSLNSAKGFIPNFADLADTIRQYYPDLESYRKEPGGKKFVFPNGVETYQSNIDNVLKRNPSFATQKKASDQKKLDQGFLNFNIDANTLGGIALVTPKEGDASGYVSAKLKGSDLKDNKPRGLLDDDQIILSNIQQTGVPTKKNFEQISSEINKFFAGPIVALAQSLYGRLYSGMQAGEFTDQLGNLKSTSKGGILPAGAEGQLFEAASKAALTTMKDLSASFDPKNENRPFDFTNPAAMNQMLGVKAVRGDAKRGGGSAANFQGQVNTLVKKSMNDGDIAPKILSQISQQSKGRKSPNAAGGFIPNFVSKSRQIGYGAEAKFLSLGKKDGVDVGVKRYIKDGVYYKEGDVGIKKAISKEWLIGQYINRYLNMPGVYGPKIMSGYNESQRRKAIRKEIISGKLGKAALGFDKARYFGLGTMRSAVKTKGLDLPDLHGANYILNSNAERYLGGLESYPTDNVGSLSLLRDMASKGGIASIIDPGFAKLTGSPARDVVDKMLNYLDSKKKTAAKGFLPNFAIDLNKTPEQMESKRIKNRKKQNWKNARGSIGKIFGAINKSSPDVLVDGLISGVEIQGLNLDYIKTLIQNDGVVAQMLLGDKGSNFVIQAKKYGVTVQQSAIKKLTSFAAKALNKVQGLSGGFLPNFADPLKDAIGREMAAGVPASQIYVDKNSSLKNIGNPMGLMVANRRDEPAGGYQGINRAIKEGRNPKTYGAASGFVPNYAGIAKAVTNTTGIGIVAGPVNDALNQFEIDSQKAGADMKKLSKALEASIKALTNNDDASKKIAEAAKKEITTRQENTANRILESKGGKKLAEKLDKIYSEYNKSQKSASDLAQAQKKAADVLKRTSLGGASQRAIVNSTASLAGSRTGAQPGQQKDMLGTIFALQGAFSILSGYTENLTGKMGVFAKELTNLGSGLSTAAFAFQGAQRIATESTSGFGKALGKAGMVGAGAMMAFEAFKFGKQLYNEFSGANERAAKSSIMLADAAANAAFSIDKYSAQNQDSLKKTTDDIFNSLKISGLSGPETKSVKEAISQTLGSGASRGSVESTIKGLLTQEQFTSAGYAAPGVGYVSPVTSTINKISNTEEVTKQLINLQKSADVTGISKLQDLILGGATAEDISLNTSLTGKEFDAVGISQMLEKSNMDDLNKAINQVSYAKLGANIGQSSSPLAQAFNVEDVNWPRVLEFLNAVKKKREEDAEAVSQAAVESEKQFKIDTSRFRAEQAFEKKMQAFKNTAFSLELSQKQQIASIEQDQTINDDERQKRINALNTAYEKTNLVLKNQEEQQRNLNSAISGALSGAIGVEQTNLSKYADELTNKFKDLDPLAENFDEAINEGLNNAGINAQGLKDKLIPLLQEALVKNQQITQEQGRQATLSDVELKNLQSAIDLAAKRARTEADITNIIEARQSTQLYQQELLSLDNSARMLSINQDIEKVKSNYTLTEYERAKKIVELEKEKKTLSEEGVDLESSKKRLDLEQQTLDKLKQQIKASTDPLLTAPRKDELILGGTNVESLANEVMSYKGIDTANIVKYYKDRRDIINREEELARKGLAPTGETAEQAYLRKKEGAIPEGMKSALVAMTDEIDMFAYNLGEKIPQMFADNMSQAISQMIEEGKSFGEVLQGAAYNFVKEINSAMIKNLSQKAAISLLGNGKEGSSGLLGSIFGYASGGPITGGSGTKDDVPAMLMGGEYVINKKSVGRYGPKFLEAINNGTLGGYAQGGKVQSGKGGFFTPGTYGLGGIQGTGNLLKFATQAYTSGARDQIVNQGNYASINLEAESARLTNFGRSNSPQAEATRSAKEQAFGLYVQEIQAQQEAQKQAEAEKDAFKKQLIMLGVTAVGSYVGGIAKTGFQQGIAGAAEDATTWQKFTAGLSGVGEKFGNVGSGLSSLFSGNMKQAGEYFSMANTNFASKIPTANIVDEVVKNISKSPSISTSRFTGVSSSSNNQGDLPLLFPDENPIGSFENQNSNNTPFGGDFGNNAQGSLLPDIYPYQGNDDREIQTKAPTSKFPRRNATGGSIPFKGGIDTVPAMLSGGEFIMNRSAAQNIGAGNLQALNAGAGTIVTEEKTEELNEKLISKLDELIEASGGASSITINVEGSTGAATQSTNGNPTDQRQQMARQIKDAVLKILQDEKRLGGQLRR